MTNVARCDEQNVDEQNTERTLDKVASSTIGVTCARRNIRSIHAIISRERTPAPKSQKQTRIEGAGSFHWKFSPLFSVLATKEAQKGAKRYFEVINGGPMFIRFVSGEIDECSHVAAGLFSAASELRSCHDLPDYEVDALKQLTDWFDEHLASPFDYLPEVARYNWSICWFKSSAREHIAKAWELVWVLERNDVMIWTMRSRRVGQIHYEDDAQVFARPYYDLRKRL